MDLTSSTPLITTKSFKMVFSGNHHFRIAPDLLHASPAIRVKVEFAPQLAQNGIIRVWAHLVCCCETVLEDPLAP